MACAMEYEFDYANPDAIDVIVDVNAVACVDEPSCIRVYCEYC